MAGNGRAGVVGDDTDADEADQDPGRSELGCLKVEAVAPGPLDGVVDLGTGFSRRRNGRIEAPDVGIAKDARQRAAIAVFPGPENQALGYESHRVATGRRWIGRHQRTISSSV
ncbi:MAG: hypothetical protein P4M09_07515 [Devosia sp.]|nr:hypothetical protein [Devosia sp.]